VQGVSPFHFLAVLLSVRSRLAATPAWLARAVRPCPCDVPLPAAQPPSQHGAVVAWDRDQVGGSACGSNQGYCGSCVYDPVLHGIIADLGDRLRAGPIHGALLLRAGLVYRALL
jgi:hypothetical protein